ncbi:uncharacterized protein LOC141695398 [Apium graveolens]|uniref:uncharacterized protein LOC141695398 n=1 Tax=Apium graveolens TaxID=4045 RepID=UPI003D78F9A1
MLNFQVLKAASTYNAIIGRIGIHAFKAVPSTYHMVLKFPTRNGVGEARQDQKMARSCYVAAVRPDGIGGRLNVDPTQKAVKQKKRTYAHDRLQAIKQEVEKLLEAGFIEENAGATYQRLVNKIFAHLIGKIMEVYVDDMLVKSLSRSNHISHLKEAFKVKAFKWIAESQEAFKQLKKYMNEAPLLAKPSPEDTLYLYLAVSEQAVSAVLVKEEQKLQKHLYYVTKAHKIEVLTDQPLRNILHSPKASGRLIKWAIELGEFDIKYKPRTVIKAQALADFEVECTINDQEVRGQEIVTTEVGEKDEETTLKEYWVLYFDGASKIKSSGASLVLQSPDGFMIEYALKLDFPTTETKAEYEALIDGLGLAGAVRAKNLKVCGDSRLVVAQVNGEFEAKDDTMANYLRVVKEILTQFNEWYAEPVPREENITADALSQFTSSEIESYLRSIYFQVLKTPTIHVINLIAPVGMESCWIDPIKTHLEIGWLPDDAQEARKLLRKFIVVTIDYFTKWIEAKALAKITTKQIAQFLWENVICRYGIPRILVMDNGKQFDNAEFREYCDDNSIELRFTSVTHPQANGKAEVANRIILD